MHGLVVPYHNLLMKMEELESNQARDWRWFGGNNQKQIIHIWQIIIFRVSDTGRVLQSM